MPGFSVSEEFVKALPKTDLHVHLDGSLRASTLVELARERQITLPSETAGGLMETVFHDRYASLDDYLRGFAYTGAVMQDAEALERVSYELAEDNFDEGVRYFEVRFAPQLHAHGGLDMEAVLRAVNKGLSRAAKKYNKLPAVVNKEEPEYMYSITVCGMRFFNEHFSAYYRDFMRVHPYSPKTEVYSMASLELAQAAVAIRNQFHVPITGFDLAGREKGYPAEDHWPAYQYAHKNFLKKTVHAGEAYGPESIFQAITDLHADRIGHGYYLSSPKMIKGPEISDKEAYVRQLAEYIADRRITIEVCLTSNMQTNPTLKDISQHAFKDFRAMRLSTSLCTDNRLVSNTTVTKETMLAIKSFGLSSRELRQNIIYGFKRSFFPGTYIEKRNYVRRIIDHYEKVEKKFMPPGGFWGGEDKDI